MATTTRDLGDVTLEFEGDTVVARHTPSGVASQGATPHEARENLQEALELQDAPIPEDVEAKEPNAPFF